MVKQKKFIVTDNHIKLLKRMYISWNGYGYCGAPEVNLKRPYGNSDVMEDIIEICGLGVPTCPHCQQNLDQVGSEEAYTQASDLHHAMTTVLQILVQHPLDFDVGTWTETDHGNWNKKT